MKILEQFDHNNGQSIRIEYYPSRWSMHNYFYVQIKGVNTKWATFGKFKHTKKGYKRSLTKARKFFDKCMDYLEEVKISPGFNMPSENMYEKYLR